jgi:hypothetical protein
VERQQLPICTDWANTSARWLARFNLGLHDILQRLIAGEGVKALDPDLERMNAIALKCAVHLKAILGFTVPPKYSPMWLLALLVEQLGLKLVSRKQGSRRKQVRIYVLAEADGFFSGTPDSLLNSGRPEFSNGQPTRELNSGTRVPGTIHLMSH